MKKGLLFVLLACAGVFIYLKRRTILSVVSCWTILSTFIPEWETFQAVPYWDVSRWSIGYGTPAGSSIKAVNPGGSITRAGAWVAAMVFLKSNYDTLSNKVGIDLNGYQWAALLSFSYNLGVGSAEKLVDNINSGSPDLMAQWLSYNMAGGKKNSNLVKRRNAEWELWNKV